MLRENEYWHFAKIENGQPVMRNGKPIIIGKTYTVKKNVLYKNGYHGSKNILDALDYAPGEWLSIRKISNNVITGDDKVCGKECTHIKGVDITDILRDFARKCALDVIHLWDAPDVVVKYLKTGKKELRERAGDAAWTAANCAARAAANYAANCAARAAANCAERAAANCAAREKQNKRLTDMVSKLFEGDING